eukprot:gnl/MRDRNA2_/MRDRNA2_28559_c0_seq2.p1 gnl/MRDRNA2_/MRDRNA2_28559_c0~~gnl/MRDRNA2_/MRDRNA2_28559_c0_seq2.p1  ORF type:complete len:333 (+),score=70.00 gnl/MRDRNA2_/MRDRNA2_28559_c0_seq2:142-1140(+)
MVLTQPKILWIITFCDFVAAAVFTCALIFPWYHADPKVNKALGDDEPTTLKLFDAMHWKANGMYILGCVAATIGGICLAVSSMIIHFFGDSCISAVGLDWLPGSSFIKGMLLRICNTAVMSCAFVGLFFGFQCRDKGDSMGLGWYMNMIVCPFGVVAVGLIYYYPFAPSGEKGMFDSEEDEDEDEEQEEEDEEGEDSHHKENSEGEGSEEDSFSTPSPLTGPSSATLRVAQSSSDHKGKGKGKANGAGKGKGKERVKGAGKRKGQSKGKNNHQNEDISQVEGKGKRTNKGMGKGSSKSFETVPAKGKGKGSDAMGTRKRWRVKDQGGGSSCS